MNKWIVSDHLLTIVLPFRGAGRFTQVWAGQELEINFRRQPRAACRCTLAFAALELKCFLERTVPGLSVQFAAQPPRRGYALVLETEDPGSRASSFAFIPEGPHRLRIQGKGRTGTLFGAYAFLKFQGWRWYAPGAAGEIAPEPVSSLQVPSEPRQDRPALEGGNGFDLECYSQESVDLLMWSARNSFDVWAGRAATFALANKLGMTIKNGGHIFENVLNPEAVLPSGQKLWDAHPEWFGLPADGVRKRELAQVTQFCASQPALVEFLGKAMLKRLRGDWYIADRIDMWGFDTWGQTCQCADCRLLGNASDQMLHFASKMRVFLDHAEEAKKLDRHVTLILCAYEGTTSLEGPTRPVPEALAADGTMVTFYPIKRCYRHPLNDPDCVTNRGYWDALNAWTSARPALRIVAGEYYNVSKHEDLPLLFSHVMREDWPALAAAGVCGATYMHIPTTHWGLRTITQNLYALLTRNPMTEHSEKSLGVPTSHSENAGAHIAPRRNVDLAGWNKEYFNLWYASHAEVMGEVYALTEEAGCFCAQWRSWGKWSVLHNMIAWDGAPAEKPLALHEHFADAADAVAEGRRSVALLSEALSRVNQARRQEANLASQDTPPPGIAVNPAELLRLQSGAQVARRLAEDARLLRYGLDAMRLLTDLLAYHEALRLAQTAEADALWAAIEASAESLENQIIPITVKTPGPGLLSRDCLERTQLVSTISRCRAWRLRNKSTDANSMPPQQLK